MSKRDGMDVPIDHEGVTVRYSPVTPCAATQWSVENQDYEDGGLIPVCIKLFSITMTTGSGGIRMNVKRYGEVGEPPFRTQRLFSENGQWYFETREGTQVGPYRDRQEVKKALAVFIAQRMLLTKHRHTEDRDYLPGSQDGVEVMVEELRDYFSEFQAHGQTAAAAWANQRLQELIRNAGSFSSHTTRVDAIRYALDLDT